MSISAIWASAGSSWANGQSQSSPERAAPPPTSTVTTQAASALSSLTSSDRSLIAAATGVVISPDGTVTGGADSGAASLMNDFVFVIAAARTLGSIQGPITPQTFASLFPPYITSTTPQVRQAISNAASYLSDQSSSTDSSTTLDVHA